MIKINLEDNNIFDIIKIIKVNPDNIIVFYNPEKGVSINKSLLIKIVFFIQNYNRDLNYYFYNIPYCFFKKFGDKYIDNHCIRNRLCNYYVGYVYNGKCNKCKHGLFCNNFNSNIVESELDYLEGFYINTITRGNLLEKIEIIYNCLEAFGISDKDIYLSITQKFIVELLEEEIDTIALKYLDFLTIKFNINGNFKDAIFKNDLFESKIQEVIKITGINILIRDFEDIKKLNNISLNQFKIYNYNNLNIKLNYTTSRLEILGYKYFFDFTNEDLRYNSNVVKFKGNVINKKNTKINTKVLIIKKAKDIFTKISNVYIGRDLMSGINLSNYDSFLLSSDNLGEKSRFLELLKNSNKPIIYDIKPDITKYLDDGVEIVINFENGIIDVVQNKQ